MRLAIPRGMQVWWSERVRGRWTLVASWRDSYEAKLGLLDADKLAFWFDNRDASRAGLDPRTLGDQLAMAFVRALWRRPLIDPGAFAALLALRTGTRRIEWILDTNALVSGIGHWIVAHFADRCDLVVTSVTLRELQDNKEIAFARKSVDKKELSKILRAQQLYLAGSRFREVPFYPRVLWRELPGDDTALLLSRGAATAGKKSESDTLMLRTVRRSLHDRVQGLERYFVTDDVALARRAATELPQDSVIASRVRPIEHGEILLPCFWWPGPDQGRTIGRSVARLIWELLAFADKIRLESEGPRQKATMTFCAFNSEMWPSDYQAPWVDLITEGFDVVSPTEPLTELAQSERAVMHSEGSDSQREGSLSFSEPAILLAETAEPPTVWPDPRQDGPDIERVLRLPKSLVLDVLSCLATTESDRIRLPDGADRDDRSGHVRSLIEGLELASYVGKGTLVRAGPRRELLVSAWKNDDLDALLDVLRPWKQLRSCVLRGVHSAIDKTSVDLSRSLARSVGFGDSVDGQWLPGGERPNRVLIREAILTALRSSIRVPQALTVYELFTEVFLRNLGVSPVRAARAWDRMESAGVFAGLEFRKGGAPSLDRTQSYLRCMPDGYKLEAFDLESFRGYRDVVERRSP